MENTHKVDVCEDSEEERNLQEEDTQSMSNSDRSEISNDVGGTQTEDTEDSIEAEVCHCHILNKII